MNTEILTSIRELDSRVSDGIHVRLLWSECEPRPWVSVIDTRTGDVLQVEVGDDERPLDVFEHPYAYAYAERRLPSAASARRSRSSSATAPSGPSEPC